MEEDDWRWPFKRDKSRKKRKYAVVCGVWGRGDGIEAVIGFMNSSPLLFPDSQIPPLHFDCEGPFIWDFSGDTY